MKSSASMKWILVALVMISAAGYVAHAQDIGAIISQMGAAGLSQIMQAAGSQCGDGVCDGAEECGSCPVDCGECQALDPCMQMTCPACTLCSEGECVPAMGCTDVGGSNDECDVICRGGGYFYGMCLSNVYDNNAQGTPNVLYTVTDIAGQTLQGVSLKYLPGWDAYNCTPAFDSYGTEYPNSKECGCYVPECTDQCKDMGHIFGTCMEFSGRCLGVSVRQGKLCNGNGKCCCFTGLSGKCDPDDIQGRFDPGCYEFQEFALAELCGKDQQFCPSLPYTPSQDQLSKMSEEERALAKARIAAGGWYYDPIKSLYKGDIASGKGLAAGVCCPYEDPPGNPLECIPGRIAKDPITHKDIIIPGGCSNDPKACSGVESKVLSKDVTDEPYGQCCSQTEHIKAEDCVRTWNVDRYGKGICVKNCIPGGGNSGKSPDSSRCPEASVQFDPSTGAIGGSGVPVEMRMTCGPDCQCYEVSSPKDVAIAYYKKQCCDENGPSYDPVCCACIGTVASPPLYCGGGKGKYTYSDKEGCDCADIADRDGPIQADEADRAKELRDRREAARKAGDTAAWRAADEALKKFMDRLEKYGLGPMGEKDAEDILSVAKDYNQRNNNERIKALHEENKKIQSDPKRSPYKKSADIARNVKYMEQLEKENKQIESSTKSAAKKIDEAYRKGEVQLPPELNEWISDLFAYGLKKDVAMSTVFRQQKEKVDAFNGAAAEAQKKLNSGEPSPSSPFERLKKDPLFSSQEDQKFLQKYIDEADNWHYMQSLTQKKDIPGMTELKENADLYGLTKEQKRRLDFAVLGVESGKSWETYRGGVAVATELLTYIKNPNPDDPAFVGSDPAAVKEVADALGELAGSILDPSDSFYEKSNALRERVQSYVSQGRIRGQELVDVTLKAMSKLDDAHMADKSLEEMFLTYENDPEKTAFISGNLARNEYILGVALRDPETMRDSAKLPNLPEQFIKMAATTARQVEIENDFNAGLGAAQNIADLDALGTAVGVDLLALGPDAVEPEKFKKRAGTQINIRKAELYAKEKRWKEAAWACGDVARDFYNDGEYDISDSFARRSVIYGSIAAKTEGLTDPGTVASAVSSTMAKLETLPLFDSTTHLVDKQTQRVIADSADPLRFMTPQQIDAVVGELDTYIYAHGVQPAQKQFYEEVKRKQAATQIAGPIDSVLLYKKTLEVLTGEVADIQRQLDEASEDERPELLWQKGFKERLISDIKENFNPSYAVVPSNEAESQFLATSMERYAKNLRLVATDYHNNLNMISPERQSFGDVAATECAAFALSALPFYSGYGVAYIGGTILYGEPVTPEDMNLLIKSGGAGTGGGSAIFAWLLEAFSGRRAAEEEVLHDKIVDQTDLASSCHLVSRLFENGFGKEEIFSGRLSAEAVMEKMPGVTPEQAEQFIYAAEKVRRAGIPDHIKTSLTKEGNTLVEVDFDSMPADTIGQQELLYLAKSPVNPWRLFGLDDADYTASDFIFGQMIDPFTSPGGILGLYLSMKSGEYLGLAARATGLGSAALDFPLVYYPVKYGLGLPYAISEYGHSWTQTLLKSLLPYTPTIAKAISFYAWEILFEEVGLGHAWDWMMQKFGFDLTRPVGMMRSLPDIAEYAYGVAAFPQMPKTFTSGLSSSGRFQLMLEANPLHLKTIKDGFVAEGRTVNQIGTFTDAFNVRDEAGNSWVLASQTSDYLKTVNRVKEFGFNEYLQTPDMNIPIITFEEGTDLSAVAASLQKNPEIAILSQQDEGILYKNPDNSISFATVPGKEIREITVYGKKVPVYRVTLGETVAHAVGDLLRGFLRTPPKALEDDVAARGLATVVGDITTTMKQGNAMASLSVMRRYGLVDSDMKSTTNDPFITNFARQTYNSFLPAMSKLAQTMEGRIKALAAASDSSEITDADIRQDIENALQRNPQADFSLARDVVMTSYETTLSAAQMAMDKGFFDSVAMGETLYGKSPLAASYEDTVGVLTDKSADSFSVDENGIPRTAEEKKAIIASNFQSIVGVTHSDKEFDTIFQNYVVGGRTPPAILFNGKVYIDLQHKVKDENGLMVNYFRRWDQVRAAFAHETIHFHLNTDPRMIAALPGIVDYFTSYSDWDTIKERFYSFWIGNPDELSTSLDEDLAAKGYTDEEIVKEIIARWAYKISPDPVENGEASNFILSADGMIAPVVEPLIEGLGIGDIWQAALRLDFPIIGTAPAAAAMYATRETAGDMYKSLQKIFSEPNWDGAVEGAGTVAFEMGIPDDATYSVPVSVSIGGSPAGTIALKALAASKVFLSSQMTTPSATTEAVLGYVSGRLSDMDVKVLTGPEVVERSAALGAFSPEWPSLVGVIPGLTPRMESYFRSGREVFRGADAGLPGYEYIFGGTRTGGETVMYEAATKEEYDAYQEWKSREGMGAYAAREDVKQKLDELTAFCGGYGIEVRLGGERIDPGAPIESSQYDPKMGPAYEIILETLRSLPESHLRDSENFRLLNLKEYGSTGGSQYIEENGEIRLYTFLFEGARKTFVGLFSHELGHPAYHAFENTPVMKDFVRSRNILARYKSFPATLFWGGDASFRVFYALSTESPMEAFAEFYMVYLTWGNRLRQFINDIPMSELRRAYVDMYNLFRDRVFEGREYTAPGESFVPLEGAPAVPYASNRVKNDALVRVEAAALDDSLVHSNEMRSVKDGASITIGRDPGNDIQVFDPKVSREHARVTYSKGKLTIKDLNSKNGVYIIRAGVETKIDPGVEVELRRGDSVRLGSRTLGTESITMALGRARFCEAGGEKFAAYVPGESTVYIDLPKAKALADAIAARAGVTLTTAQIYDMALLHEMFHNMVEASGISVENEEDLAWFWSLRMVGVQFPAGSAEATALDVFDATVEGLSDDMQDMKDLFGHAPIQGVGTAQDTLFASEGFVVKARRVGERLGVPMELTQVEPSEFTTEFVEQLEDRGASFARIERPSFTDYFDIHYGTPDHPYGTPGIESLIDSSLVTKERVEGDKAFMEGYVAELTAKRNRMTRAIQSDLRSFEKAIDPEFYGRVSATMQPGESINPLLARPYILGLIWNGDALDSVAERLAFIEDGFMPAAIEAVKNSVRGLNLQPSVRQDAEIAMMNYVTNQEGFGPKEIMGQLAYRGLSEEQAARAVKAVDDATKDPAFRRRVLEEEIRNRMYSDRPNAVRNAITDIVVENYRGWTDFLADILQQENKARREIEGGSIPTDIASIEDDAERARALEKRLVDINNRIDYTVYALTAINNAKNYGAFSDLLGGTALFETEIEDLWERSQHFWATQDFLWRSLYSNARPFDNDFGKFKDSVEFLRTEAGKEAADKIEYFAESEMSGRGVMPYTLLEDDFMELAVSNPEKVGYLADVKELRNTIGLMYSRVLGISDLVFSKGRTGEKATPADVMAYWESIYLRGADSQTKMEIFSAGVGDLIDTDRISAEYPEPRAGFWSNARSILRNWMTGKAGMPFPKLYISIIEDLTPDQVRVNEPSLRSLFRAALQKETFAYYRAERSTEEWDAAARFYAEWFATGTLDERLWILDILGIELKDAADVFEVAAHKVGELKFSQDGFQWTARANMYDQFIAEDPELLKPLPALPDWVSGKMVAVFDPATGDISFAIFGKPDVFHHAEAAAEFFEKAGREADARHVDDVVNYVLRKIETIPHKPISRDVLVKKGGTDMLKDVMGFEFQYNPKLKVIRLQVTSGPTRVQEELKIPIQKDFYDAAKEMAINALSPLGIEVIVEEPHKLNIAE